MSDMILNSLLDIASFAPASTRFPSAWIGHLPFAAWVIRRTAPSCVVELGTHSGNSYFSFCQTVLEAGLETKCYAVDTWQGDEHSGRYDETVFTEVQVYNEARYAAFSRLLRMTFDDAVSGFPDKSIDLLHIDGLHTYDAVRHDFETWLPKLAPGALILLHDTMVREPTFGVWKLWEEVQRQYPLHIEFSHSYGLGVLQLNDAPEDRRQAWLQFDDSEKATLRRYFAALGARQLERFELNAALHASRKEGADLGQMVAHRDGVIAELRQHASNLEQELAVRDNRIATLTQGRRTKRGDQHPPPDGRTQ
jgi:Methyltransferase domain